MIGRGSAFLSFGFYLVAYFAPIPWLLLTNETNRKIHIDVCGDRWGWWTRKLLFGIDSNWKNGWFCRDGKFMCRNAQTTDVHACTIDSQNEIDKSPYRLRLNRASTFYKFITLKLSSCQWRQNEGAHNAKNRWFYWNGIECRKARRRFFSYTFAVYGWAFDTANADTWRGSFFLNFKRECFFVPSIHSHYCLSSEFASHSMQNQWKRSKHNLPSPPSTRLLTTATQHNNEMYTSFAPV